MAGQQYEELSPYSIDNWDEPDSFRPERWLTEETTEKRVKGAWQPFSRGRDPLYAYMSPTLRSTSGPKNCVGLEVALIEQRIILAAAVSPSVSHGINADPRTRYADMISSMQPRRLRI